MDTWRRLSRSHLRTLLAGALGASGAAAYAYVVGCSTGSCPLTSSAWRAALFGFLVGAIAGWPQRAGAPAETLPPSR
jgi:membrane associated rhomboid family serine protease